MSGSEWTTLGCIDPNNNNNILLLLLLLLLLLILLLLLLLLLLILLLLSSLSVGLFYVNVIFDVLKNFEEFVTAGLVDCCYQLYVKDLTELLFFQVLGNNIANVG